MDVNVRRESRIPRGPPGGSSAGASAGPAPLEERSNTLGADRKRKAAALSSVPESKRRATTRTTKGPFSSSSAPAAAADAEAGKKPAAEETFEDIAARTGMGVKDILDRKLAFKKGTMPAKKLEEMGPVIKELKAVGWHLLARQERAEMDAQQWRGHAEELEAKAAKDTSEWAAKQESIDQQMQEIRGKLSQAESSMTHLQEELGAAQQSIAHKEATAAELQRLLGQKEEEMQRLAKQLEERDAKIRELEELVQQGQKYSATLQSYNTSLQGDVNAEKAAREELLRSQAALQGQVAELGGMARSLEQLLKQEQEQVAKLRTEREAAGRDAAVLRTDLDVTRGDRDRLAAEVARIKEELRKIRAAGGKSAETIEALSNNHATLEAQLDSQRRLMESMRGELGAAREGRAMAESLNETRGAQLEEMKAQISNLQASLADAERRVYESELIRRKLHNTIQELKGNIRVFCRIRPPSDQEMAAAEGTDIIATELPTSGDLLGRGVDITVPGSLTGQPPHRHAFTFDKVFGPSAGQDAVFAEISELVQSALDGHKVCIFAYGQTGSGKTFTMLGDEAHRGIIPRAMQQVFESSKALATQGWAFTMQASMLEIYNEEYKDLLAKKKLADGKAHKVVHDAAGGTTVSDLTLVDVTRPEAVEDLLAQAMQKRSVGCTLLNEHSSRSHMVFTLRIEGVNVSSQLKVSGVLNLIDLAGSERVKESGATGVRMKEAQNINKSLSALGDVIMSLANKADHIPYRNSKLTWLLQPSLGGDAKTLMFVNISPARDFAPESLCSLRFAAKVNACEIGTARRNVKPTM